MAVQTPAPQRHIVCMKWGTKYGPEYVNRLYAMVRRHLRGDFHFVCLTDDAKGIRAEAHEDINTITLLLGAEEAGLEILDRDGKWLPASPPPGALSVNVGDMLQRLTNNRLPSTTHRVRNPDVGRAAHSRYSLPFFLHFRSDFLIETLPECIDAEHPNLYSEPITADDYLQERLREIGLKK